MLNKSQEMFWAHVFNLDKNGSGIGKICAFVYNQTVKEDIDDLELGTRDL